MYDVGATSDGVMFIPSFVNVGQPVQNVVRTQHVELTSLLFLLGKKKYIKKMMM
jgi:hypothetical protein